MKIRKLNYNNILKYISLGFICLTLSQAKIGELNPFLCAFFFACLYVGVDEKIISAFTLFGGLLAGLYLENFLIYLTIVAVGLIVFYVHKFAKRKMLLLTSFISFVFSNVTYIYYHFHNFKHWLFYLLLGMICLFVFITVLQVMFLRKNCFKLTLDESVCFLFAMATVGLG